MVHLRFNTPAIPRKISARLSLKVFPENWQEYAQENIRKSFPPTLRKHGLRILNSEDTEHAFRYMISAAKGDVLDLEVLVGAIHTCATALLPSYRPSRKRAKQIADDLRYALRELDFVFTHQEAIGAVTVAADIYDEIAKGKPGRPSTPAKFAIIDLVWRFKIHFGHPVHDAIAHLWKATFPDKEWTVETVKQLAGRYLRPLQ
jgi:hypothetical protein